VAEFLYFGNDSNKSNLHSLPSRLLYINLKFKLYEAIILLVVLYGCETWYVTLREEHRFEGVQNRVLRRIFGPKREEVAGGWRRPHDEELHNLYTSSSTIEVDGRGM
jgi:hypothetical protein